jgi:hypothetical protein
MTPQYAAYWTEFEDFVAQIYRVISGSAVQRNVNLAGNQVDIYFEEETSSGHVIRTAVECKYYHTRVPKSAVLQFATVSNFLRQAGLIDKAVMIAYQGFTQDAQLAAKASNIDLRSFQNLELAYFKPNIYGPTIDLKTLSKTLLPDYFPNLAFVVMPFSETLEDTYIYGIRGACEKAGLQCKRADEIEHSGVIIEEVLDHIRRAEVIIAELTDYNPNVFYEVGWAHALGRTTVLIAKKGTSLPFDVRHINTVFYTSIKDLEKKLATRLQEIGSSARPA